MSEASTEVNARFPNWVRSPLTWTVVAALVLAGWLYYPLFFPETNRDLSLQGEQFFFEANEAAGAPVLLLSLWLFYRRSHYLDLLKAPGAPHAAGFVFAITIALFIWGHFTGAPDLQLASIIGLLTGAALLLGGTNALRAYWLPILFLGFALPISPVLLSAVLYPVQLATAQYAGFILNAIGVPSFVQGDQILRPENTFVVIETCSGMRTVVTLTMLTVLLIDLFERRGWHAVALILMAPIVAFLTNGVRVVTLVLNPYSDVASIHNLQGIAMLLIGLTVIYLIDELIERIRGAAAKPGEAAANAPEHDALPWTPSAAVSNRVEAIRVSILCGILIVMHASSWLVHPWPVTRYVDETSSEVLDRALGEWASRTIEPDYNFMGSVGYLTWDDRRVEVDGSSVDVFLAAAEEQRRERTILTPRLAWPASGYVVGDAERRPIRSLGPVDRFDEPEEARRLVLRRGPKSVLSYSWYERAASLPVEWFRQAAALERSPFVRPRHILAIRLSTTLGEGRDAMADAEARIRRVYERLAPELADFAQTSPN